MSTSVIIDDVSKLFRLYHERASSLKERIVNRRKTAYEEFWALKDVSFEIETSQTAGLIGRNGSGKTTLLKLVAGIIRPTKGRIETRGRIASLLELGAGFHPDLTGRQNVYLNASVLGFSKKQTDKHFDEIVAFSELEPFIDMQVRHYSSGMYVRLGFAVAVHVDPEILIVDEVLAVGDEAFQRRCLGRIREFQKDGRTIVFVSHAVDLVREICTKAVLLEKGQVVSAGPPPEVIDAYRRVIHGGKRPEGEVTSEETLEERGSFEMRITEAKFLDANGEERKVFSPGDRLDIVADVKVDQPVDDWTIGVRVYDEAGRAVWGTNTKLRDIDLGRIDRDFRFRWSIPSLPLLDGRCALTLAIVSEGRDVYWREKGWMFEVVSAGNDLGHVNFDASFEIERS